MCQRIGYFDSAPLRPAPSTIRRMIQPVGQHVFDQMMLQLDDRRAEQPFREPLIPRIGVHSGLNANIRFLSDVLALE